MTDAIKEIGANYEKEHPNVKLTYNFGSLVPYKHR